MMNPRNPSFVALTELIRLVHEDWKDTSGRRPGYSLRAHARRIGVSPSFLCEIWSGKKRLGRSSAERLWRSLRLTDEAKELLWRRIELELGVLSEEMRERARRNLQAGRAEPMTSAVSSLALEEKQGA